LLYYNKKIDEINLRFFFKNFVTTTTANKLAVSAQFEIFGNRDLFNCSVKKMQLSEQTNGL